MTNIDNKDKDDSSDNTATTKYGLDKNLIRGLRAARLSRNKNTIGAFGKSKFQNRKEKE